MDGDAAVQVSRVQITIVCLVFIVSAKLLYLGIYKVIYNNELPGSTDIHSTIRIEY